MRTDTELLAEIDAVFELCPRPKHFTNYMHCEECAEHDALLRSRDRISLALADVANPGWDPICFCSAEGIAYYMPALVRLALAEPTEANGWYGGQLMFHLWSAGPQNRLHESFTGDQRRAIASLLLHFIESRASKAEFEADQLFEAYERWCA